MDNATFDRLARLLAGGASRRHALRAIFAAALTGAAADELLAAKKNRGKNDRGKNDRDKKNDDKDDDGRGRAGQRDGAADRVSAQGKKGNKNKKKRKRKNKRKPNTTNGGGGNSCAGIALRPGQTFLGCDFSERNLRGRDLNSSLFKDVDLTDADLCGANLESTSFTDSDADGANFTDVNFDSSSHDKTGYANANLTNATFRVATFNEVDFSNADLTGADFTGATFADIDFSGAIFCRTTQPNGRVDNRDCDICDNTCGLCDDCGDDCAPPDCCPDPETGDGVCVDTDTDPLNCGGCDAACFTNLSNACVDGECVCGAEPECSGNRTCCPAEGGDPAFCANLNNDVDNCGACGFACLIPTNPCESVVCQGGQCVIEANPNGSFCEVDEADGICCTPAGGEPTCIPGELGEACCTDAQCDATEACCDNECIDVESDPNNCGACEEVCAPSIIPCVTNQCIGGSCTDVNAENDEPCSVGSDNGICCRDGASVTCEVGAECCTDLQCTEGFSCCGNQCFDVRNDFSHCGGCLPCDPEKADACTEGLCTCNGEAQCGGTETCCSTGCVDTDTSFANCGECGDPCPASADTCESGQCICSGVGSICPVGNLCCGGDCTDINDDPDNCGACGNECGANDTCESGTCTPCAGKVCDNVCQVGGECCVVGDCEELICQTLVDCDDNQCVYEDIADDTPCEAGRGVCNGGQCVCGAGGPCAQGLTCCNGQCVDTTSSRGNCGGCNQLCASISSPCADVLCINSQCTTVSDPEFTPCLDGQTEGICCGAGAAAICVANGVCCSDGDCDLGETCCSGQCVDTDTSLSNCGGCGQLCPSIAGPCIAGVACIGGDCLPVASTPGSICELDEQAGICCAENSAVICEVGGVCCDDAGCAGNPDGSTCCGNQCVDTQSNVDNCGACGETCNPAKADGCLNGLCICGDNPECSATETCCSDECVDTNASYENCGGCGETCLANADTCTGGECVCGELGAACSEGDFCCAGTCLTPGPGVCCIDADCPSRLCQIFQGCTNNTCVYTLQADETFCGFGGQCLDGECINQQE